MSEDAIVTGIILFFAMLLGLLPAMIAKTKGRSFFLWWLYGGAVFIVALIHSLIMKNQNDTRAKYCPNCAEKHTIKEDVCSNCGENLPSFSNSPTIPELREKYNIAFSDGKYHWNGVAFDSFDAALVDARSAKK
jgi:hypothetical protein